MTGKLTRRQLAAALSAPALLAQAPAPPPQSPADELKAAENRNRQISDQLGKFPLPMTTEPATHFKA